MSGSYGYEVFFEAKSSDLGWRWDNSLAYVLSGGESQMGEAISFYLQRAQEIAQRYYEKEGEGFIFNPDFLRDVKAVNNHIINADVSFRDKVDLTGLWRTEFTPGASEDTLFDELMNNRQLNLSPVEANFLVSLRRDIINGNDISSARPSFHVDATIDDTPKVDTKALMREMQAEARRRYAAAQEGDENYSAGFLNRVFRGAAQIATRDYNLNADPNKDHSGRPIDEYSAELNKIKGWEP